MSAWTHIIGTIETLDIARIFMGRQSDDIIEQIKDIMGPQSYYYEPNDNCKLPMGSEGSLHYMINILETEKEPNGLQNEDIIITFTGHLRDFDNKNIKEELIPWFENLIDELNEKIGVRSYSMSYSTDDETKTIANAS